MKRIVVAASVLVSTIGMFSFTNKAGGDVLTADVAKSKVEFVGSKSEGYHPGFFLLKSGEVSVENGKLTGGKFTIDLSSLKITDDAGAKLEGHLKSPDFFDVAKNAEATYVISNVSYTSDNKATIEGSLTLKGVTSPVKLIATIRNTKTDKFFADASFSLDRIAAGLGYGKGMIADDVLVTVHLFAKK